MSVQKSTKPEQDASQKRALPPEKEQMGPETAVAAPLILEKSLQRALRQPSATTPRDAAVLQRTLGNRAIGKLVVQPKLTVGPAGDQYEQEADAVAKQVVQRLSATSQPAVQRQEEEELQMKPVSMLQRQEEEEELQMKPLPAISALQRQEEEEEVQMKPVSMLQRQEEEEELQMKPLPAISTLQRQEEEELQMKPDSSIQRQEEEEEALQMKTGAVGVKGGELLPDLEQKIQSARGGGQPLADPVRRPMEQAFGADLSGVRVHSGGQSDALNRSIQARAFTTGSDIFFRSGEYNPANTSGQELLAHELTHVVQQGGAQTHQNGSSGGVRRKSRSSLIQRFSIKKWFKKKTGSPSGGEGKSAQSEPQEETQAQPEVKNEEEQPQVDPSLQDAVEYERNLGNYAFSHPKANTAATAMVSKMTNAMIKDFDKEDQEHRQQLVALYGRDKVDSAGQVGTEFSSVFGAISEGNLRERLTALMNAMFGPFKEYVTQAMKESAWAEMEEKGLNVQKLQRRKRQMKFNIGAKDLYRDPGNPLDRKRFSSWKNVGKTRYKKDESSERTVGDLEQSGIGLSEREKALQFGQEVGQGEDISDQKLKWKEGGTYWAVNKKNKWVQKVENSLHMPVVAGPSGSMLRMFQLWEFLNKPISAADWRLAVLGWMLSSNDHSFHEMMMTAADFGPPYTPGQLAYMKVNPLTVWELRDNVAKDGLFPHELAFKRKTESGGFHMLDEDAIQDAQDSLDVLDEEDKGAVSAPATAMIKLYSEFGYLLLNPTKEGGMLLKKKVENAIRTKPELAHIKGDLEDGKFTVDDLINEARQMLPMMESALEMLPDWSGDLFRGTGTFSPWSYRSGSSFTFGKFGSSTLDEEVAKDFADNYNKGPYKYILKMKVTAGKDIRQLASYAEDEILLPPGSKFAVKDKEKKGKYTYVNMDQTARGGDQLELGEHTAPEADIEEDVPAGPTLTYYGRKGDTDPYDVFANENEKYLISPDHEEEDWTEFLYLKEGTYYWAKTAELNAFLNPPQVNETDTQPQTTSKGQLLTPDPKTPIPFMDFGGNEIYLPIDVPTHIEVLDEAYPDELQGWENVEIKNLDTGQIGYINFTDLKKYLSSSAVTTESGVATKTSSSEVMTEETGPSLPLSSELIQVLGTGADLDMLTQMGMVDSEVFKELDTDQVAKLAEVMGTSVEDVESQISAL